MNANKPTFYVMIIMFILCLSLSIYGGFIIYEENKELTNDFQEFYFDGKLYFYENENLLGTYECVNDFCGYATSSSEEFLLDYYTGGTISNLGIINSDYVFLQDGEEIFLYSISLEMKLNTFDEIKFYDTYISENYVLVSIDGLWGAISLSNLRTTISAMYEELSVLNLTSYDKLTGEYLLAKVNGESFIINSSGEIVSDRYTENIVYADENYIVTNDYYYRVYDYFANELLTNYNLTGFDYSENYYVVVWDDYAVVYTYFSLPYIEYFNLSSNGEVTIVEENQGYTVFENEKNLTN